MWIQERVEEGDLDIAKVPGEWNPADLMTKGLSDMKIRRFMIMLSQEFAEGRATEALELKK